MCCGKFKKISVTMYILAVLFILKYIFIVAEPKVEPEKCALCSGGTIKPAEVTVTAKATETKEEVIEFPAEEIVETTEVTEIAE